MPVNRIVRGQKVAREKIVASRQLRQKPTPEEMLVWDRLRGKKLGPRFRQQQVIGGFVVDFFCHAAALVVEIDGDVHLETQQAAYDAERTEILVGKGLHVIRFSNAQVHQNLDAVIDSIATVVAERTAPRNGDE
jgi:very-short-patch-repair endonuclease